MRLSKNGQGTVEYLLLTSLVVGVVLAAFNEPLRRLLDEYTSRKSQYTQVVSQRRLGIPIAWFRNPPSTIGGGGATAGGATEGGDAAGSSAPSATSPTGNNAGGPGKGDTAGGDNSGDKNGGDNPAGGPTAGGANAGSGDNGKNFLLKSSGPANLGGNTGRGGKTAGDNAGDADDEDTGGGGNGGRTPRQNRGDGNIQADEESKKEEDSKEAKIKKAEESGTLDQERRLYGSRQERVRRGGCGDLDLKVILQIAFVVGLLFLLASMLFQKRGDE